MAPISPSSNCSAANSKSRKPNALRKRKKSRRKAAKKRKKKKKRKSKKRPKCHWASGPNVICHIDPVLYDICHLASDPMAFGFYGVYRTVEIPLRLRPDERTDVQHHLLGKPKLSADNPDQRPRGLLTAKRGLKPAT